MLHDGGCPRERSESGGQSAGLSYVVDRGQLKDSVCQETRVDQTGELVEVTVTWR